jgi:hypothetical protein
VLLSGRQTFIYRVFILKTSNYNDIVIIIIKRLALKEAVKAQTGSRDRLYFFCNLSARMWWVVNATLCRRERDPVPTVQEAG